MNGWWINEWVMNEWMNQWSYESIDSSYVWATCISYAWIGLRSTSLSPPHCFVVLICIAPWAMQTCSACFHREKRQYLLPVVYVCDTCPISPHHEPAQLQGRRSLSNSSCLPSRILHSCFSPALDFEGGLFPTYFNPEKLRGINAVWHSSIAADGSCG